MIQLITYTSNPMRVLWYVARQCTAYKPEQYSCVPLEDVTKTIKGCLSSGHDSILEHVSFTFRIDGISRACTHQLVRHRMASFAQVSQRYVNQTKADTIIPYTVQVNPLLPKVEEFINYSKALYQTLINNGIPKEDARAILPENTTTSIIVTMNARELIHFFKLRCCFRSQSEIRNVAYGMLNICKEKLPVVFNNVGPKCTMEGGCRERVKCKCYNPATNRIKDMNIKGMPRAMFHTAPRPTQPLTDEIPAKPTPITDNDNTLPRTIYE